MDCKPDLATSLLETPKHEKISRILKLLYIEEENNYRHINMNCIQNTDLLRYILLHDI